MTSQVPVGFEEAHTEWLRIGGPTFRALHRFGPRPDFYRSHYWNLVKQALLTSKGFKCCRCNGEANQAHHLNYHFVGEDHLHPETLVVVCRSCHGLIEYARKAEQIVSRITRRISLCQGFLEDARGCLDQNAAHVYARLLEYQDELAQLRSLFANKIQYRNPRIKSVEEARIVVVDFRAKRRDYEEKAVNLVSVWSGSEKEKTTRMLPLLEIEIQNCRKFAAEVFAPVSANVERLPVRTWGRRSIRQEPDRAVRQHGVSGHPTEALVVGIKYHRGNVDGIAIAEGVHLIREPTNPHDRNAVQVSLESGEILGYLAREYAATISSQMDAGVSFQAQVSRIGGDRVFLAIIVVDAI